MILKLKSISGGSRPRESKLDAAQRSIRRIEIALAMRAEGYAGPRVGRATLMFGLSLLVVLMTDWGLAKQGLNLPAPGIVSALLATAVSVYVMRNSDVPRTRSDKLDHELAKHDPIDLEAYRQLQKTTMEMGCLDSGAIKDWICMEEAAIYAASPRKSKSRHTQSRFLNRKV